MSDIAVRVENLSKQYRIGGPQAAYKTIRESLTEAVQAPFRRLSSVVRGQSSAVSNETLWALKDVSFEVERGEVVGIIGRNGAGKTTLLKILSRITEPTEGCAEIHGRVGSLLEVGTGFHPELTGRENIYLNGAILGMKRAEIDRKFDEIVAFAEIEKFMDTPVKRYSSGMYVRLAFAVAAHLEPEILLVDEVLAVGDAAFQKKCLGKMGDVASEGRTVLFVSHNLGAIEHLCKRVVLLTCGKLDKIGQTNEVIQRYLQNSTASLESTTDLKKHAGRSPGYETVLHEVKVYADGRESTLMRMGGHLRIETLVKSRDKMKDIHFGIAVEDYMGQWIMTFPTSLQSPNLVKEPLNEGIFICDIPSIRLIPGTYYLTFGIVSEGKTLDRVDRAIQLTVIPADIFGTGRIPEAGKGFGMVYEPAVWTLRKTTKAQNDEI